MSTPLTSSDLNSWVPVLSTADCQVFVILMLLNEVVVIVEYDTVLSLKLCPSPVMYVSARTETCWMV